MGMSELVKGTTDATLSGTGDWFRSFNETDGQSWQQQLKTSDPTRYREHKIGNLVWKQLRKNGTQTWFQYGDNDFLEAIMSITGSVIVRDLNGDDSNPIITLEGGLLTMNDLLEGGAVTLYDCGSDTDQCMMDGRSTHTVNLTGLRSQILDVLIGGTSGVGLIHKYANNTGPITNAEKNLMSSLPGSVGSIIRNLAVLSPDAAQIFAQESSGAIALSMVNNLVENMLRAGRLSLANTNHAQRETAIKMLNNATQQARHEYVSLINQYGRVSDMTDHYNNLIKNIRKQRYMLTQMKQSNNKD
jgi:conjugative transfer pilus assembly protein TraH